jgi:hypothetical protein
MACATTGGLRLVKLRRLRGHALTGRTRSGQTLADIRQQQDGYKDTPDFSLKHCRHFALLSSRANYTVFSSLLKHNPYRKLHIRGTDSVATRSFPLQIRLYPVLQYKTIDLPAGQDD